VFVNDIKPSLFSFFVIVSDDEFHPETSIPVAETVGKPQKKKKKSRPKAGGL